MADGKLSDNTAFPVVTAPASTDMMPVLTDPTGTPVNNKATNADIITKAHGLSDGIVKVDTGVMAPAVADTDYQSVPAEGAFADGDKTKLDYISVTQAVDLDQMEIDIAALANGMVYKGNWDASLSSFPGAGVAQTGWFYTVSVGGTVDGVVFNVGDRLIAIADNASTTTFAANWTQLDATDAVTSVDGSTGAVDLSSTYQPLDSDLTTIAGLTATSNNFIASVSSAWASVTPTDATALLDAMVGDSGAGGTKGLVPAPATGDATAGKYLKADGTWATPSGGSGQSPYDVVIASSGGDYTTLDAYFTAGATAGDVIYIQDSHTLGALINDATNNLTIVSSNPKNNAVLLGGYTITLSGTNIKLLNVGFDADTNNAGKVTLSGNYADVDGCYFHMNALQNQNFSFTGLWQRVKNSTFHNDTTTDNAGYLVRTGGAYSKFTNNYIYGSATSSNTNYPLLRIHSTNIEVTANTIYVTSSTNSNCVVAMNSSNCMFTGNNIICSDNTKRPLAIYLNASSCVVSGNSIWGYFSHGVRSYGNYNVISSNSIVNQTATSSYCIAVESGNSGNLITNNYCTGSLYGIYVTGSTSRGNRLINNLLSGNTNDISDSGTGTYKDNQFYNAYYGFNFNAKTDMAQNKSGASVAAGSVIVMNSSANPYEFTTTTTAGDNKVLGIALETIANNANGYIQTLGKTTLVKADGTTAISVGDFLTTSTTAGIAQKATTGDTVFAVALEAYATADTNGVLDAMLITPRKI